MGGGEVYLLSLARAAAAGGDVEVAGAAGSPLLLAAAEAGLPTRALGLGEKLGRRTAAGNALRAPLAHRRLHAELDRAAPGDWFVLQYLWEELLWGGRTVPPGVALIAHGPIAPERLRLGWVTARLRCAYRRADALFAVSRPAAAAVREIAGREPTFLPAGVDVERARAARAIRDETRRALGVGPAETLLVYAGRIERNKGVLALVRALERLPEARAAVVGAGGAAGELRGLVDALGLRSRVQLPGRLPDPFPYLAAADATVLLSRDPGEGRPLAALESGAVGTPVVGLGTSPALRALAEEAGGIAIHLVEDDGPQAVAAGVRAAARRPRPEPVETAWEDAAEILRETLDRARPRPARAVTAGSRGA
jgi:glycosyltransferase involved in cell wall biosynthesis